MRDHVDPLFALDCPLLDLWRVSNQPRPELFAAGAWHDQVDFVGRRLGPLLGLNGEVRVAGTHTSKSTAFPVYRLALAPALGDVVVYLRGNLHDWKASVVSDRPLDLPTLHTVAEPDGHLLHACYFEGFPEGLVFPGYAKSDRRRFSAMLHSAYEVAAFVALVVAAAAAGR